jgi:hypothetical protein
MNPLTVNPAIVLDQVLHAPAQARTARGHHGRRPRRAVDAARTARVALERAGL